MESMHGLPIFFASHNCRIGSSKVNADTVVTGGVAMTGVQATPATQKKHQVLYLAQSAQVFGIKGSV